MPVQLYALTRKHRPFGPHLRELFSPVRFAVVDRDVCCFFFRALETGLVGSTPRLVDTDLLSEFKFPGCKRPWSGGRWQTSSP